MMRLSPCAVASCLLALAAALPAPDLTAQSIKVTSSEPAAHRRVSSDLDQARSSRPAARPS